MDDASDTSDEARRLLLDHWRNASAEAHFAAIARTNGLLLRLIQDRQDATWPDATPRERLLRRASLWIDRETMITRFGWDPEVHGQ